VHGLRVIPIPLNLSDRHIVDLIEPEPDAFRWTMPDTASLFHLGEHRHIDEGSARETSNVLSVNTLLQ
jgi:hypothetical protein